MQTRDDIRNIAIIAHVDHGKTTLVDCLLRQTGAFRASAAVTERVLDSNDLERERGITILAKNAAVRWQGVKVNLVDTPGHADFGGEVERVLNMVDGALLLVDAVDGPMPQTRFVLGKALALGLRPLVVVNKADRPEARSQAVVNEVFDMFVDLGASDEQADFDVIYASARDGWAATEPAVTGDDIRPLLDAIISSCPPPMCDREAPLQLLVSLLDYDSYVGRLAIGRVLGGSLVAGATAALVRLDGTIVERKVQKLVVFEELGRVETGEAAAGEIVAVAGFEDVHVGETIADTESPQALPPITVEEPTLSIELLVNDSPFAGKEGKYVTSRQLGERLEREQRKDVALRVEPTASPDAFRVSGRGELHLGILIENMRRAGYEFALSRPEVLTKTEGDQVLEPIEHVLLDLEETHMGRAIEMASSRGGHLRDLTNEGSGRVRIEFDVPTRGLLGFRSELLTETRGTGIMHASFNEYRPLASKRIERERGVMIAKEQGDTTAYALEGLEDRGYLFFAPGARVYGGQIVGVHSRDSDIVVNPCKRKHLTNMRSSTADIAVKLTPPTNLSLEQAIQFIQADELVEVTPESLRLRKKVLDHSRRKVEENRLARVG